MKQQVLAGLGFLMLVPGILCAEESEVEAVRALEKYGAVISRADNVPGHAVVGVRLLPRTQTQMVFSGMGPKEDKDQGFFKHLAALKELRELELYGRPISGKCLAELVPLTQLKKLDLSTKVTDADLMGLAALKQLEEVRIGGIGGSPVTDAGIKEIAGLTQLRVLKLIVTNKVTDMGLKELAPLKKLQTLYIVSPRLTDAGLKNLAPFGGIPESCG